MLELEIKGAAELQKALGQLPVEMERNISRSALRAGARVIEREAKALAPVGDAGELRDSIRVSAGVKKGGTVYAHVSAGNKRSGKAWYAHFVEFGTKPHYILAKRSAGETQLSVGSVNRYIRRGFLRIGEVFRTAVVHPGARAKPFMRPAVDSKAQEAVQAIGDQIRRRLDHWARGRRVR